MHNFVPNKLHEVMTLTAKDLGDGSLQKSMPIFGVYLDLHRARDADEKRER